MVNSINHLYQDKKDELITISYNLTVPFVDKTFVDDRDSSKLLNHVMDQTLVLDSSTLFESLVHYFGH